MCFDFLFFLLNIIATAGDGPIEFQSTAAVVD